MKFSAGIWAFRKTSHDIEILLVHPGGPFYVNKDNGAWSIPKGEFDPEKEDALEVAIREFTEETGNIISLRHPIALAPFKTKFGKTIYTWAQEANFDTPFVCSNNFEIEWPPKSGKKQEFPEVDKAEWFSLKKAEIKLTKSQLPLLFKLKEILET